ncbi:hypothetical protein AB7M49_004149 [Bradyrhizobium elkanii]
MFERIQDHEYRLRGPCVSSRPGVAAAGHNLVVETNAAGNCVDILAEKTKASIDYLAES